MAGKRPQFFLADLVAIVALAGLALALVQSFWQRANPAGIYLLFGLVAVAWTIFRAMRGAPACEECGRRFLPPRKKASPSLCPQCGQPQLGLGRSRNPLKIAFWVDLALLVVAVVLIVFATMDLVGSARPLIPGSALGIILPLMAVLLPGLFDLFLFAQFPADSARQKPVPCEKCGSTIPTSGTSGPLICPRCRLRQLPKEQLRKEHAKGFWIIFALLLIIGFFAGFMLTGFGGSGSRMSYWIALPVGIVATVVGLPAIFFVVLLSLFVVQARRFQREPFVLARARKASGEEGEVVRSGAVTVWYWGPVDPAPLLMEQMEATRSSLESLLGRKLVSQPPLRVLCFRKRSAFEAFVKPFYAQFLDRLKTVDGLYIRPPYRVLALCTDEVPYSVLDRDRTACAGFCDYFFLELSPDNPPPAWLQTGIPKTVTSDLDDHARLNRKMLVSLARRTALGTGLFKLSHKELANLLKGWSDHRNFEKLEQFSAESWSVCEYLGGKTAPEEQRDRFRAFLNDPQSKEQPEDVFKRHFGFGFGRLSETWREWVQEQGIGSFSPPRPLIQDQLLNRVIPLIEDRQAKREDRILAIRTMGIEGHVLGADALIDLLRRDDAIPREVVVWALEAISGMAYGDDADRWAAWRSSLPLNSAAG